MIGRDKINKIILIPTYNEAGNLTMLIEALRRNIRADILIIDDNSPDGTGLIAEELKVTYPEIYVIHRDKKLGIGSAYVCGYEWALKKNYNLFIQMDCDFSHQPEYINNMIKLTDQADLVIGSRYVRGVSCYNWPFKRILISKAANYYVEKFARISVKDSTSGFKVFKREVLLDIDITQIKSCGYAFQIETTYRAWKKGFTVIEFPIIFHDRINGKSKISRHVVYEAFLLVIRIFLRLYR